MFAFFLGLGVWAYFLPEGALEKARVDNSQSKWNTCQDVVNEAVPDPNDTEQRSALMKDCFEN